MLYAPPTGYLPIHDYVVQKHHQKKETKRIRLLQLSLQTLNETFLYEYASVVVPNCLEELKRLASTSNASNKSVEVSFLSFFYFFSNFKNQKKNKIDHILIILFIPSLSSCLTFYISSIVSFFFFTDCFHCNLRAAVSFASPFNTP